MDQEVAGSIPADGTTGPLAGLRVVELAGLGPGPYAGQLLADLGAEVVCIDRPGPKPPFVSDRGKRSVVLDLRKEGAAEAVLRLCERSEALIEGFRPGVAERLGLGPEAVQARAPDRARARRAGGRRAAVPRHALRARRLRPDGRRALGSPVDLARSGVYGPRAPRRSVPS